MPDYTVEDLANLRSLIASGVSRIAFDNKQLDFAKLSDLLQAEQVVSAGIDPVPDPITGTVPRRSRQLRVFASKGL